MTKFAVDMISLYVLVYVIFHLNELTALADRLIR